MEAAESEMNIIFDDVIEHHQISSSQEEILRHCPFFDPDDGSSDEIPVTSTGIAMASLPETAQDTAKDRGSQDVFHTPPEQQFSQSASEGCGRAIHKAVETHDETQGFFDFSENAEAAEYVDLRDDSELGFPQGVLNQGIEPTLVAECLDGKDGARLIKISRSEMDNFQISNRESPSKNWEQNPVLESSQACFGIEPQRNHSVGTSGEKNSDYCEHLGTPVTQSKIAKSTMQCVENIERKEGNYEAEKVSDEGNKTVEEIAGTSERQKGGNEQPESGVFPSSSAGELLKHIAKIKKEIENGNDIVFDVFKAITKEKSVGEDRPENVNWLHFAKSRGFKFPRPYWWKEEDDNEKN